jgi:hypothetical protein
VHGPAARMRIPRLCQGPSANARSGRPTCAGHDAADRGTVSRFISSHPPRP